LDRCRNKTFPIYFLSLLSWSKLHNPLFPSHRVTELGAVFHSDRLQHLLDLVLLSSGSFCLKRFIPILQSFSYGSTGEKKLEFLLTAGSYCTGYFNKYVCHFQQLFLQTNLNSNMTQKIRLEKQAFVCFEMIYNQMRHKMISHRNHGYFRFRGPNFHYHRLRRCNHHHHHRYHLHLNLPDRHQYY
jgi:hypothetical protein